MKAKPVLRCRCPHGCEQVDLPVDDVTLWYENEQRTYRFTCPECHNYVTKMADDTIHKLLVGAGVQELDVAQEVEKFVVELQDDELIDDWLDDGS